MNIVTRINGRKVIPVSDRMQAIFLYGELGFPCQLYHDNISNFHENVVNWHWQNDLEFSFLQKGEIEIQFLENKYTVKEGEGYLIFPDHLHRIVKLPQKEGIYNTVIINPTILYGKNSSAIYHKYYAPIVAQSNGIIFFSKETVWGKKIFDLFESMVDVLERKDDFYEIALAEYLMSIWKIIISNELFSHKNSVKGRYRPETENKIKNMLSYIHREYANPLSLKDIAHIGNMEKGECCQIFKKYVHTTPIKYLMQYRIEQSIPLLLEKDKTITEVAFSVGFNSINHYINTFKKMTGSTPYHYKKIILQSLEQ